MLRSPWILIGLLTTATILPAQEKPIDVPLSKVGTKYRLIGKLQEPLGTVVTVQGLVEDGPFKGYEGGPNICVQRINGRATQQHIRIKLVKGWTEFHVNLLKPEAGIFVELKGYETGEFVGVPDEAMRGLTMRPQVPVGHSFIHKFVYHEAKRIDPVSLGPADLVDREALLGGKAMSEGKQAYIGGKYWRLLVGTDAAWPKDYEGKTVEGFGIVRKTDKGGTYSLEKATTRLVKLEDQLGKNVALRGTAWSESVHWWLDYRGTKLYVENMKKLPKWHGDLHAQPVLIEGVLDEEILPYLRQLGLKNPDKIKYYIVRKASWKPIDALLSPERE